MYSSFNKKCNEEIDGFTKTLQAPPTQKRLRKLVLIENSSLDSNP